MGFLVFLNTKKVIPSRQKQLYDNSYFPSRPTLRRSLVMSEGSVMWRVILVPKGSTAPPDFTCGNDGQERSQRRPQASPGTRKTLLSFPRQPSNPARASMTETKKHQESTGTLCSALGARQIEAELPRNPDYTLKKQKQNWDCQG